MALKLDDISTNDVWYSAEDLNDVTCSHSTEVQQITEWLNTDLPFNGRKDVDFVMRFLTGCKFDVKKTKQRITRYYENRRNYPDLLTNRDIYDETLFSLFTRGIMADDEPENVFRAAIIFSESILLNPEINIEGIEWLVNLKDIPGPFIRKVTPKILYKLIHCILLGLPIRIKSIHAVNVHPAVMVIVNCFKMLLTPKLRKRLHLHRKSWECLRKHFSPIYLPNEYGGSGGTIRQMIEENINSIRKSRNYLLDDEKYGFPSKLTTL